MIKTRNITLNVQLTDPQHEFITAEEDDVIMIAGRGAGKTYASILRAVLTPPKTRLFYISSTYRALRDVSKAALKKLNDSIYEASKISIIENERIANDEIDLIDGKTICFRSADNYEKLRGISTGYVFIDEAALIEKPAWDIIAATLREGKCRLFITTTPRGKGNWVYDLTTRQGTRTKKIIKASTLSNKFIDAQEYYDNLKLQYTSEFAKQELDGDFIDGSALMKPEWLKYYDTTITNGFTIMAVDPAISLSDEADYTAFAILTYKDGKFYIENVLRMKVTFRGIVAIAKDLYKNYHAQQIVVEDVAFQKALVQELGNEGLTTLSVKPHKDKVARFMNTAAKFENGLLFLKKGINQDFIDELMSFPDGAHDDMVDALAYVVNAADESCNYTQTMAIPRRR